jgi:hypothetical protein
MWCHYCDMSNNNHNTADCREIAKFKQQKKAHFEAKDEKINELKRQLKPEKTASSKNRNKES